MCSPNNHDSRIRQIWLSLKVSDSESVVGSKSSIPIDFARRP